MSSCSIQDGGRRCSRHLKRGGKKLENLIVEVMI